MQKKKMYAKPEFTLTEFECEDIITNSGISGVKAAMESWSGAHSNASIFDVVYNDWYASTR